MACRRFRFSTSGPFGLITSKPSGLSVWRRQPFSLMVSGPFGLVPIHGLRGSEPWDLQAFWPVALAGFGPVSLLVLRHQPLDQTATKPFGLRTFRPPTLLGVSSSQLLNHLGLSPHYHFAKQMSRVSGKIPENSHHSFWHSAADPAV